MKPTALDASRPQDTGKILSYLESHRRPEAVEQMKRFGVVTREAYGLYAPELKSLAKEIGRDHALAGKLWKLDIHETRVLAALIADPSEITEKEMDRWAAAFDNWAVCDACCLYVFGLSPFAWSKAVEWSRRSEEYVKRAGFALMAVLAVHDKKAPDHRFEKLFRYIIRGAADERNFVKKAVNWALRQIGKRSLYLNKKAIPVARELKRSSNPSARWIGSDALRELTGAAVQRRLRRKRQKAGLH